MNRIELNKDERENSVRRRAAAGRRALCCAFLFLFLVLLIPAGNAETQMDIWISPTGELTIGAIKVMTINSKYYLFLPGNINLNEYRIGTTADTVTVNGLETGNGEKASLFGADGVYEVNLTKGRTRKKIYLNLYTGSRLPAVYITTESGSLRKIHRDKSNKEAGSMILSGTDGDIQYNGELTHFKMRGNASTRYNKRNYAIKLAEGTNLLRMGKARKWILIGNHLDKSLIRNQITFDMARYAGLAYTPDCRQVALYVNHEYMGLYLLTEKIEIDDDRVDIRDLEKETERLNDQELDSYPIAGSKRVTIGKYKGASIPNDPEDISGGYILEYEHAGTNYTSTPSAYFTRHGICLLVHEPEYCSDAQMRYITGIMQAFENAIFSRNGRDPETGKHYSELVDMDSLVNKYLINEISKNYDANMSSEYFYKPDDSVSDKVFAGPVWDLDNSYGDYARNGYQGQLSPTGMTASKRGSRDFWWPALYRQPDFYRAVVERYHERFVPAMEILLGLREETETLKSLDTYASAIEESAEMEFIRYPSLRKKKGNVQTGKDPAENIAYLKNFIRKRMEYLNSVWIQE